LGNKVLFVVVIYVAPQTGAESERRDRVIAEVGIAAGKMWLWCGFRPAPVDIGGKTRRRKEAASS
jgi:hypothetical protein